MSSPPFRRVPSPPKKRKKGRNVLVNTLETKPAPPEEQGAVGGEEVPKENPEGAAPERVAYSLLDQKESDDDYPEEYGGGFDGALDFETLDYDDEGAFRYDNAQVDLGEQAARPLEISYIDEAEEDEALEEGAEEEEEDDDDEEEEEEDDEEGEAMDQENPAGGATGGGLLFSPDGQEEFRDVGGEAMDQEATAEGAVGGVSESSPAMPQEFRDAGAASGQLNMQRAAVLNRAGLLANDNSPQVAGLSPLVQGTGKSPLSPGGAAQAANAVAAPEQQAGPAPISALRQQLFGGARPKTSKPKRAGPKVNRNLFNPLSTPEKGEAVVRGPASPQRLPKNKIDKLENDFVLVGDLGRGCFGSVQKWLCKLDGSVYAIKRQQLGRNITQDRIIREIMALAALGSHPHIIRYYGAWALKNEIVLQLEYCNGGSLEGLLEEVQEAKTTVEEDQLKHIILHIAEGLKFMHRRGMVHNDIKPANLLMQVHDPRKRDKPDPRSLSLFDEHEEKVLKGYPDGPFSAEECMVLKKPIYKITDLGLVFPLDKAQLGPGGTRSNPSGDGRYWEAGAKEDPARSDVYCLGVTVYELARGFKMNHFNVMEKDSFTNCTHFGSPEYHRNMSHISLGLKLVIEQMTCKERETRLSAASLTSHDLLNPAARELRRLEAAIIAQRKAIDDLWNNPEG